MSKKYCLSFNLIATYAGIALMFATILGSCSHSSRSNAGDTVDFDSIPEENVISRIDTDTVAKTDVEDPIIEDIETTNEQLEYMRSSEDSDLYMSGILPVVARDVPDYAEKLLQNRYDKFIVVDKARMLVLLYDKYGHELRSYKMACGKKFGNKHKRADSRTPEGFFSVEGIYDSTEWLFTDDEGNTSKKKGQFGPRFIRLKIPTTSQIGIHGTCASWSLGGRGSHGCIRIANENILELVELVEPGMPVIVLPGKRDRAVNREEGRETPYFATASKYAMTESEKKAQPVERHVAEPERIEDSIPVDTIVPTTPVETTPDTIQE